MIEIEKFEEKLRLLVIELLKDSKRNVHVEIDAEHVNQNVKVKTTFNQSFK